MGGPSGPSGGGSNRYEPPKKKNPIVEFIKGGGVTGAIVKSISSAVKKGKAEYKTRKTNTELLGTSDYQGGKTLSNKKAVNIGGDNNNDNNQVTQKSIEQPKVKSQMNNTDVKSDMITSEAPAVTEMTADEILLKNKRKGRKKTILTSVTGVDAYPTLSKKTLLG
jgi:hypothetical protein